MPVSRFVLECLAARRTETIICPPDDGWVHTLPSAGDVTEGYIRPSIEHLRGEIGKVAIFLLERMVGEQ